MRLVALGSLLLALACSLGGCLEDMEPYQAPYQWHPVNANSGNLRAMVANPHDLEYGQAASGSEGDFAAAAVIRLRSDVVRRMPPSAISDVKTNDTAPAQGGPGDAPTPAAPVAAPANAGGYHE
jgi:hypothetical protein